MMSDIRVESWKDGGGFIIEAGYWTPEWARFVVDIKNTLVPLCALGVWLVLFKWIMEAPFTSIDKMVFGFGAAAVSFLLSWALNNFLSDLRGGYFLRPHGNKRLRLKLTRNCVNLWEGQGWCEYPRALDTRFVIEPSREAKWEEREERRTQQHLPYTDRDAWTVWLQLGEQFIELASVSTDIDAKAIVRRLQSIDEFITRGGRPADHDTPFGPRSAPE